MSQQENNMLELTNLIKRVWLNKKIVYLSIAVVVVIGTVWSLAAPKEYLANTKILSDKTQASQSLNRFSKYASLAGINLPVNSGTGEISPASYDEIISSLPFQKELLSTSVTSRKYGEQIKLQDYLIATKEDNLQLSIRKYSVKLPSTFLRLFKSKKEGEVKKEQGLVDAVFTLSAEESLAIAELRKVLNLEFDENTGAITIEAMLPEPRPAAEVAKNALEVLEKLIKEYKTRKAQNQLEFLEGLHEEKKVEYERAKDELAEYQDANRIISNSRGLAQQQVLQDKYNLSFGIYNQITSQLEAKKIEVQENIPVFSIIQPSIVPKSSVGPNHFRAIVVALFVGIFVGLVLIFLKELKLYLSSRW